MDLILIQGGIVSGDGGVVLVYASLFEECGAPYRSTRRLTGPDC